MKLSVSILFVGITFSLCQAFCKNGLFEAHLPSQQEADFITDNHNQKRLLIAHGMLKGQPKGDNLKKLKWDWDLAKAALNVAKTCEFRHVLIKDKRFWWVGQNLYTSMSTAHRKGADWNAAINAWFDEYKLYRYPDDSNHNTGHYTQLAWADTTDVGCAYTYYRTNGKYKYQKLYVCNYGPGGNVRGQKVYHTGTKGCENLC